MTYLESYMAIASVDGIKQKGISDTKVAIFMGGNPNRLMAIENAMNEAISKLTEKDE